MSFGTLNRKFLNLEWYKNGNYVQRMKKKKKHESTCLGLATRKRKLGKWRESFEIISLLSV